MIRREIALLPEAQADLVAIEARIRLDNGGVVAIRNIANLFDKIDLIAEAPGLGSIRHRTADGTELRFFRVKRWWLVYEDREARNLLVIHGIIDTMRDLSKLFP